MLCSNFSALWFSLCSYKFCLGFISPVWRCPQCRHLCVKRSFQLLLYSVQRKRHFKGDSHLDWQLATERGWMNHIASVIAHWLERKSSQADQMETSEVWYCLTFLRSLCIQDLSLSTYNIKAAEMCRCNGLDDIYCDSLEFGTSKRELWKFRVICPLRISERSDYS